MKALDLIKEFQATHSGMSTFLDDRIQQIQIAIQDAQQMQSEGKATWFASNLYTALTITKNALKAIPHDAPVRDDLEAIYIVIKEKLRKALDK